MRRLALLAVLVAAATAVALASSSAAGGDAPASGERPKIAFDRMRHEFGAVKQNAEVKTEFTVENKGTAPLHVQSVRGDCGCANASISEREVRPGGKSTISVTFHTYTFVGPQKKHVHVVSDDPEKPEVDLEVLVDVS